MIRGTLKKVFGSRNERLIKRYSRTVSEINALEERISALSDSDLANQTGIFRQRLAEGASLNDILPEAFATVRETSKRVLNMRHFDVQLIGGMALHEGKIAEMRTGEGKTLVATLPAYLNALEGHGVHVITVNDYLARRDAEWMGPVYDFLGLTTGTILSDMENDAKHASYYSDITYGTNNQFGFDYLIDNLAFSIEDKMQRELNFAIVDEVDSILIDEARTPLIISGAEEESSDLYIKINKIIPKLSKQEEEGDGGDYYLDEKGRQVFLTEHGHEHAENLLKENGLMKSDEGLYDAANISLLHYLNASLKAHTLFERDVQYVVQDNEIVIVDEFTGRATPGRRWSEGIHQAVEAKEGVPIKGETQTAAAITFQNYFRLYNKLAGMTGTADTEAFEFQQIYALEVVVIPTHKEMIRRDDSDLVFLTAREKFTAILSDIKECKRRGQPVLVGTASIDSSEKLSELLKEEKISHQVLNAKQHAREAEIITQAGKPGAVTIATNMAGRGTDIVLGGNVEAEISHKENISDAGKTTLREQWAENNREVLEAGGLHIIGTERNESRRVDNQLRGRSGRQGDPGSSRFYLSLEDNLMRIFASDRISMFMQKLGMQEGEAIEHPWVTKAIENAQRKVEGRNFEIRKQLLEYDDVANDQRKLIYAQRNELMSSDGITDTLFGIMEDVVNDVISIYIPPGSIDEMWDIKGLTEAIEYEFGLHLDIQQWLDNDETLHEDTLRERIFKQVDRHYAKKEEHISSKVMKAIEKQLMLKILDSNWREHLSAMSHLRQSINLRSYGQKNPKHEYRKEAYEMFSGLLDRIKHETITTLLKIQVQTEDDVELIKQQRQAQALLDMQHADMSAYDLGDDIENDSDQAESHTPYVRENKKIGRNAPCPCGSGKKFKHCHGRLT